MDSKHPPNSSDRILTRFKKIVGILKTQKIDGLLLNFEPNVTYAVGFHAPDAYGLITTSGITLVTDFRYVADFQAKTWGLVEIKQYHGSIFKTVAQEIRKRSLKHVGFESRHLSFAECEIFHQLLKNASQFIPLRETIEPLREVKDTQEIKSIKKAIAITQKTFSYIRKFIKPRSR